MNTQINKEIKIKANGEVDVNYYIDEAHRMRSESMTEMYTEFKGWVASHLHLNELKFSFAKWVHH